MSPQAFTKLGVNCRGMRDEKRICSLAKKAQWKRASLDIRDDFFFTTVRRYEGVCYCGVKYSRLRLKCDGTRAETRFCLSAKRTNPFKSAGVSVQSTTGSRGLRISGSNAGYTMFRVSVKGTGYPLYSPVSPSLPLPCVTVCHHISSGLYFFKWAMPVVLDTITNDR